MFSLNCSATKESQSLNLTVLECSDLALLDFHYMALFRIITTTFVRYLNLQCSHIIHCSYRSGLLFARGLVTEVSQYFLQALFPFQDWWVVPAKVAFDQTAWSALWNSIYFVVLGLLRLESPGNIFSELRATFWPMLTVSFWQFALILFGILRLMTIMF